MKPTPWPLPRWIAHRGAGRLAPENTLAAFRVGFRHGFRAFECDVKLSADGEPFLLHDADLERTTSGSGVAGDLSWDALSRLDAGRWLGPRWVGEPLPRLAAIAGWVRANGCALNLEIKATPGLESRTGDVIARACKTLFAPASRCADQGGPTPAPAKGGLLLSSFQVESLRAARAAAPELPRALLLDRLWHGWDEAAGALECMAVVCHHKLMDAALRDRLRDAGWRALCYTVNDPAEIERLLALDVDGLITDAVDRFGPAAAAGQER